MKRRTLIHAIAALPVLPARFGARSDGDPRLQERELRLLRGMGQAPVRRRFRGPGHDHGLVPDTCRRVAIGLATSKLEQLPPPEPFAKLSKEIL